MDDRSAFLLTLSLVAITFCLSAPLALWLILRIRRASDQPASEDAEGTLTVPVRGLQRHFGFFGKSRNSLNPRLQLTRTGLTFKVFQIVHWPFETLREVDARLGAFGTGVTVTSRSEGSLSISLSDAAKARDLLRALPATVPLTARARELRDG